MLNITYYTDPLCCWSWGFEPQWRRLLFEYEGCIEWTYRMGGLIPAWDSYHDAANSVSRPIQLGPVWMHAAQITGMPISSRIWMEDPPASSYPSCIAVCCAALQSQKAAESYLRLLRKAIMVDGINIAMPDTLRIIARQLASSEPTLLDSKVFNEDFDNGKGIEAFKKDVSQARSFNINRFPTLVIKATNGPAIIITGYRYYDDLISAIHGIAPQLQKTVQRDSPEQYRLRWPDFTDRELKEAFSARVAI